jgi:hypothetical protein
MSLILSPHAQGTPEWLADRAGKATGSAIKALYVTVKTGEAAARRDYRFQLAVERLTGSPAPQGFVSADMAFGTEQEPFSRMAMEAETGQVIQEYGFCYFDDMAVGCSVDGLFPDGGLWESKSPKTATHIGYIEGGVLPAEYVPQVTHNVWVTDAPYAVFTSFDPRLPEHLQLFHVRVERAVLNIEKHERMVKEFLKEVDDLEAKLRGMRRGK